MAARGHLGRTLCGLLAAAALSAGAAWAEPSSSGAELYELCAQCHGTAGEGNALVLAPKIAGLDAWYVEAQVKKFRTGLRGIHPEDVAGLRMHPMARALKSDDDISVVAGYVEELPPVRVEPVVEGGDTERGAAYYAPCAACHGNDAAGNEELLAPSLRDASDWYLLSSLQRYKAGVRGANVENVNAQIMRGLAASLPDDQAMKDVVAYIMSLSNDGTE